MANLIATSEADRIAGINDRADESIAFYDRMAGRMRHSHYILGTVTMVSAALVTVASLLASNLPFGWTVTVVTGLLGVAATVARSIESLWGVRDSWVRMAATREQLTNEKMLFTGRSSAYTGAADPIALYADRVAAIIASEYGSWAGSATTSPADKP